MTISNSQDFKARLQEAQQTLVHHIEQIDTGRFCRDEWTKENQAGGGVTCVIENGSLFEGGGINISYIQGEELPQTASTHRQKMYHYQAMGLSLILHPRNPYVPTVHLNVRMFYAYDEHQKAVWWFGGGTDLTPFYGFTEDAQHFHRTLQRALDTYDVSLYPVFKKQCDDYFYLPHRQETRGIGGIFFDDFHDQSFARSAQLPHIILAAFLPAYLPIVHKRALLPYGQRERDFQCYRRGRYVEFNLLYDRGTLFGLQSKGRTESILVSLPPQVHWRYNWVAEPGSKEAELSQFFLVPRNWITDT